MTIAVETIKKRADFLKARKSRRVSTPAFLIQAAPNGLEKIRAGYTVTKKIGNAVVRNRIKRRFRALVRDVLPLAGQPGTDYIFIARPLALTRPFTTLLDDLHRALVDPRHPSNGKLERPRISRQ